METEKAIVNGEEIEVVIKIPESYIESDKKEKDLEKTMSLQEIVEKVGETQHE